MKERRRVPRHRILKSGKIILATQKSAVECTVRNLTGYGALLQVTRPVGIPDRFDLELERDHARHACRVIWRRDNRLGVEFG
jgi:hypothetical protein